jgi:hypothetical protein
MRFASNGMSREAEWEIGTKAPPAEYLDWLKPLSAEGYVIAEQTESSMTLRKSLSGDIYTLQFTTRPSNGTADIEVRFTAIPD